MVTASSKPVLTRGSSVEVFISYSSRWASGFEVHDGDDQSGYALVRRSDRTVLPERFPPDVGRAAS